MATSSSSVDVSSFSTDAKFRAWSLALSTAIQASGLTKTSDTGQIDHTTVSRPTAANTKAGYEIYRFNDTLQSTKPIFIRIDYGTSLNGSGLNPSTWLTVGTATDNAGTISGVGMTVVNGGSQTATAASNTSMLVGAAYSTAAGAATIIAGLGFAATLHPGVWVVSRTTDSSGVPDGNGVVVHCTSGGSVTLARGATFSPAVAYSTGIAPAIGVPYVGATVSSGGSIQLYKAYAALGILYPTMGLLGYYAGDIVSLTPFTAAPFGSTTRTYMGLGLNAGTFSSTSSANINGAVIWE